jgi:hypothetical protein
VSDRRIYLNAVIVTDDLTNKVVAWATEIARYAAQLPSRQARDDYLRERRRELVAGAQAERATPRDAAIVADACVDAARRIMTELLALRAGVPQEQLTPEPAAARRRMLAAAHVPLEDPAKALAAD